LPNGRGRGRTRTAPRCSACRGSSAIHCVGLRRVAAPPYLPASRLMRGGWAGGYGAPGPAMYERTAAATPTGASYSPCPCALPHALLRVLAVTRRGWIGQLPAIGPASGGSIASRHLVVGRFLLDRSCS
ncbi:hypothetical protein PVAP13_5NG012524, partial [Panicum virgatum]